MLNSHRNVLGAVFAVFICACGSSRTTAPGGQSNTPAPQIVTTSVKEALKGELYSQPLSATGGTAPLVWSLPAEPKEIPWLTIDSSSGGLSGTPSDALVSGKSFVVQVKDHDGRADQKTFTLTVRECNAQNEGHTFPCHIPSDDACFVGTRTCTGGRLGECIVGNGSASTDYCGPDCLACGTSANVCTGGRCFCGTEEPCGTTERPDCCYESYSTVCTNRQTDPKHCGDCDNECDKDTKNVVPTCVGGTCITPAPCRWGYARCPLGSNEPDCSTNTATDLLNCGACDNRCPSQNDLATKHATPSCQNGQCQITCTDGARDCNGQIVDGCECVPPIGGSMNCTSAGECVPQCPADHNMCLLEGVLTCISKTNNDVNNCGTCGRVCQAPLDGSAICNNGVCGERCPTGTTLCRHRCVRFPMSVPNGTLNGCSALTCEVDHHNCDDNPWNGCETTHLTNPCLCRCPRSACRPNTCDCEFGKCPAWTCNSACY